MICALLTAVVLGCFTLDRIGCMCAARSLRELAESTIEVAGFAFVTATVPFALVALGLP